jgi:hypothetical protein
VSCEPNKMYATSARQRIQAMFAIGFVVILAGVVPTVVFAAQPTGKVLNVTVTASRISLIAREAPLANVLTEIARQSGVKLVLAGDLNTPVTETLANVPLDDAIQRLSRWHSVVLIYTSPQDRRVDPVLIEAWVTASFSAAAHNDQPAAPGQRTGVPTYVPAPEGVSRTTPEATSPLQHRNPAVRIQGIQALVREQGDSVSVEALRDFATRDPAPGVRLAAIRGLSSLNSPAAGLALEATLEDQDAAIRAAANSALGRWRHRFGEGAPR